MSDANKTPEAFFECPRCRRPAIPGRWDFYPARGGPTAFKCSFCTVDLTIPRRAWGWGTAAGYASFLALATPLYLIFEPSLPVMLIACVFGILLDGVVGTFVAKRLTDHLVALQD